MKVYIVEVVENSSQTSKISQDGFKSFEDAQKWCRSRTHVQVEENNGWKFIAEDYEYVIHDILIR